jgi:hypothetical protein
MAYAKIPVTKDEWTLIIDGAPEVTFQNAGQFGVYINFTSDANTAPTDEVGLVYGPWQGELRKDVVELTNVASPVYVWAKSIANNGNVIVET